MMRLGRRITGHWRVGMLLAAVVSVTGLAGCERADTRVAAARAGVAPAATAAGGDDYEIWVADQGLNLLWVYDADLNQTDTIDLAAHGAHMPHMIDFTSDFEYAFVANMHSGNVTVIRAWDRAVVATIATGPATHMAGVSPDDTRVIVDIIGTPEQYRDGELLELTIDTDRERFEVGRRLRLADVPLLRERADEFADLSPICHKYSPDGRHAYITLGPSLDNGGLVVLDTHTFEIVKAWSPRELRANCGTMPTLDGRFMFVNGGGPQTGVWYVIDMETQEVVHEADSRGWDAHGVWPTPDGREMWMVNRVTDNAIVIDTRTFEIVAEVDFVGDAPDIMGMSSDGQFAFITLRGPNPMSAPHVAVGTTPGFAVVDVPARRLVRIVEPASGNERSDPHAIAVRHLRGGS
jgi:DNA-binding beta-propeller fold protein YncE